MSTLPPGAEADHLIEAAAKPKLGAYWLEALLLIGVLALALGVWCALTRTRTAAVVLNDIRKGAPVASEDVAYAPLIPLRRTIRRDQKLEGHLAARDLERGTPLQWTDVVAPRPRAAAGQVEVPLKLSLGTVTLRANAWVFLGVVASEGGEAIVIAARVLAVDASSDPAHVTVAMNERDAARFAVIPKPQIQVMQHAPREQKR